MVILDRIDPRTCRLAWGRVDTVLPGTAEIAAVERRLQELGIVHFFPLDPVRAEAFAHRWNAHEQTIVYRSQTSLDELSTRDHAFYVAAALATVTWASVPELLSIHLALYELIVNVHEHGRPLSDGDGRMSLRLEASTSEFRGSLTDGCERFDPSDRAPVDIPRRLARRENRGYGVAMIERALDEIGYQYGPDGNVVTFKKRIHT